MKKYYPIYLPISFFFLGALVASIIGPVIGIVNFFKASGESFSV